MIQELKPLGLMHLIIGYVRRRAVRRHIKDLRGMIMLMTRASEIDDAVRAAAILDLLKQIRRAESEIE